MEHSSYCVLHCAWGAGAAYTSASNSQPDLACSSLQLMRLPLYREDCHLLTYLHIHLYSPACRCMCISLWQQYFEGTTSASAAAHYSCALLYCCM